MAAVSENSQNWRFGAFEVEGRTAELRRNGVAIRLQEQAFLNPESIDTKFLELMMRYQNTNHRSFTNTLKVILTAQKERVRQEREFDSQQDVEVIYSKSYDDEDTPEPDPKTQEVPEEPQEEVRTLERPPGKLA